MNNPLPSTFWVMKPNSGKPAYFILQSTLPPVEPNASVVAGPFSTHAEAQTWISNHTGGGGTGGSQQWYVGWSHAANSSSGSGWKGVVKGPYAFNSAPVCGTITVSGTTYPACTGPYSSRAAALAFIASHPNGPPSETNVNIPIPTIPNPFAFLAWIQDIGHWLGTAVAYITDGAMYRSIGWIVLGFIFALAGILLWLGKTRVGRAATEIGAGAAVAA